MKEQELCENGQTFTDTTRFGADSIESQHCLFIDQYEVEEMLGEYYDFSSTTPEQWLRLDSMIKEMCEERGVTPSCSVDYYRICDVCCGQLKIKAART